MSKKKIIFLIFFISIILLIYNELNKNKKKNNINIISNEKKIFASNIIKDVNYSAQDKNGNRYNIKAKEGEIDQINKDIIYLTEIEAIIQLADQSVILVKSKFGKFNNLNYDTIFTKEVSIQYGENELNAENLDFSLERGSIILSTDIKYKNSANFLRADVIEIDLETKDSKIYMNNLNKKVIIKSLK